LSAPVTNAVSGAAVVGDSPASQFRALFPGVSEDIVAQLVAIVELEGAVMEQRTAFSIRANVGHLAHYQLVYTPDDRRLQWRQIIATVAVPVLHSTHWGVIGKQPRGGVAGFFGGEKDKYGTVYVPRGLTDAETHEVHQHLLNSVKMVVANQPMGTKSG